MDSPTQMGPQRKLGGQSTSENEALGTRAVFTPHVFDELPRFIGDPFCGGFLKAYGGFVDCPDTDAKFSGKLRAGKA